MLEHGAGRTFECDYGYIGQGGMCIPYEDFIPPSVSGSPTVPASATGAVPDHQFVPTPMPDPIPAPVQAVVASESVPEEPMPPSLLDIFLTSTPEEPTPDPIPVQAFVEPMPEEPTPEPVPVPDPEPIVEDPPQEPSAIARALDLPPTPPTPPSGGATGTLHNLLAPCITDLLWS